MPLSTLVASAAVAVSATLGASFPTPASAPVSAPLTEAQAPTFAVGEEWEFDYSKALDPKQNAHYTQKVVGIANGQTSLAPGDGRRIAMILDENANIVRIGSATYSPSDQKLSFPLSVGKAWSASYVYVSGSWKTQCERQAKVVGVERVETETGTFDAFRIEEKTLWQNDDLYGGRGISRETDWYAPAVGRIVKLEYQDLPTKGPATTTRLQLIRHVPAP
jgi:hypothetical protein